MSLPEFQDFLYFGERQRYRSQDLYNLITASPSIHLALNIPPHPHIPHADESWNEIQIEDRDSMILRSDPYFVPLLRLLKDERVPINSMKVKGLNWFNFPNTSAFRSAFIPFPHICVLDLDSITCSKNNMKNLVASMPKLIRLILKGCKLQGEGGSVTTTILQRPTLQNFSIAVIDGDYSTWDLFISPESPVDLSALKQLFIEGDGVRLVFDRTMVFHIQALLDLTKPSLERFEIGYINMNRELYPLHIEHVQDLSAIISLTDDMDQMNSRVQWWTTTFLALPSENQLEIVTIVVAVDQHKIQGGSMPLCDPRFWNALDDVLCRPEINLCELRFYIHAQPYYNYEYRYIPGYNYRGVMHWLCMHCLPRCRAKYESASAFTLLDERSEAVDECVWQSMT